MEFTYPIVAYWCHIVRRVSEGDQEIEVEVKASE